MFGQGYVGTSEDVRRIRRQQEKREKEKAEFEAARQQSNANVDAAGLRKFDTGTNEVLERAFKDETAGLVSRADFILKRDTIAARLEEDALRRKRSAEDAVLQAREEQRRKNARANQAAKLSFAEEEEAGSEPEDQAEDVKPSMAEPDPQPAAGKVPLRGVGKDPTVPTDFLPDRERERQEEDLRHQLKTEFQLRQQAVKNEKLEVTFSYWDGAGHRRTSNVRKGDTVLAFLQSALKQLLPDFRELRALSVGDLMYVKEDLIIPHSTSFYDLIMTRARGKTGPLFFFDVHEDLRLQSDARRENNESHAGKVVANSWYNRNKHIFPANRWEPYDSEKQYEKSTLRAD